MSNERDTYTILEYDELYLCMYTYSNYVLTIIINICINNII